MLMVIDTDKEIKKVKTEVSVNKIIDRLFLGNELSALDKTFFINNKIQVVINCTPDVPHEFRNKGVEYLRVSVDDSLLPQDIAAMTSYLPFVVNFLYKKHAIEKKNVLVHCHAGMQRSAIVVAGYILKCMKMKPMEAINFIIDKRPIAFLNGKSLNFKQSLSVYYCNNKPKTRSRSRSASKTKSRSASKTKSRSRSASKTKTKPRSKSISSKTKFKPKTKRTKN